MNKTCTKLNLITTIIIWLKLTFVFSQITSEEIDNIVERTMENFTVAGVAVAVVKDGEIIEGSQKYWNSKGKAGSILSTLE